jgi:hypothetical protein
MAAAPAPTRVRTLFSEPPLTDGTWVVFVDSFGQRNLVLMRP